MQARTLRTVGATVVLLGIAIAAMAQAGGSGGSSLELAAPLDTTSRPAESSSSTSLVEAPFHYRVGLLAGVSTTNYWEYLGTEPTAWNTYVLGPTKPALFGVDPNTYQLVADLAVTPPGDLTWDEDGWRARVELRDDQTWSDGTPITADDLAFTFETVRRLGLQGGWGEAYPAQVEEVVAESPTTLRIEFTERPGLGVWPYGVGLAPMMPAHIWEPHTASLTDPASLYALDAGSDVSGGPLQIVSMTAEEIRAAANPGRGQSGADTVSYTVFASEEDAAEALAADEIDVILSPKGLQEASLGILDVPGVEIERSPANSVRYLGFNLERAPMSDPAFRAALALLLDREAVTAHLVPGGTPAFTMVNPANQPWFDQTRAEDLRDLYTGDLAERLALAVDLLADAGYTWEAPPSLADDKVAPGTGLRIAGLAPAPLTILTPGDEYDPARPEYVSEIEETLELLGFDVRPVVTDFDTVVDLAFTETESGVRQYDMYLLGWTLGNPALPDFYGRLFGADGRYNSTGYSNRGFTEALRAFESASDREEARDALWELEGQLAGDLPYLTLYHPEIVEAYRSDRVRYEVEGALGGIQGRLGGVADVASAGQENS